MNTILLAVAFGMTTLAAAYADSATWHRFKEYDIGNPRPAGQPSPITAGR